MARRGYNKAVVALAAKNARLVWTVFATGKAYNPPRASSPELLGAHGCVQPETLDRGEPFRALLIDIVNETTASTVAR